MSIFFFPPRVWRLINFQVRSAIRRMFENSAAILTTDRMHKITIPFPFCTSTYKRGRNNSSEVNEPRLGWVS